MLRGSGIARRRSPPPQIPPSGVVSTATIPNRRYEPFHCICHSLCIDLSSVVTCALDSGLIGDAPPRFATVASYGAAGVHLGTRKEWGKARAVDLAIDGLD